MNSLNLRISGEKKKKSLKHETKEDLSSIITKYDFDEEKFEDIKNLINAESMEEQIIALKKIMKAVNLNANNEIGEVIIKLYLDIFVSVNTKSPLKTPVFRLLMSTSDELKPTVQKNFELKLKTEFSEPESDPSVTSELVSTLCYCLENNNTEHLSISPFKLDVLEFVEKTLQECYLNSKEKTLPPTQKLQIFNCAHTCTRCLISLLQKNEIKPTRNIFNVIIDLLMYDQMPLDTRSNCGILSVMMYKRLNGSFDWFKLENEVNSCDKVSQLNIISGMLSSLDIDDLASVISIDGKEINVLNAVVTRILGIEESNSADCSLVLLSSRCLLLATKCMVAHPDLLVPQLLNRLLPNIWIYLDHYMDAVRHLASSMLSNLVRVGKQNEKQFVIEAITKDLTNISVEKRSKNVALSALIGHISVKDLLKGSPGLIESLLQSAKTSAGVNHIISSLESLLAQHYKEKSDTEEWYCLWINPLLDTIGDKPNAALEHVLTSAIKLHPGVIDYVGKLQCEIGEYMYSIFLICLRVGRKFGLIQGKDDFENWKGYISFSTLSNCMVHSDDEVRISCFALIVETQKSTEEFSEKELSLIKLFLKYNIKNECPSIRQKGLAYFKKFISRFKDSLTSCERSVAKDANQIPEIRKNKEESIKVYEHFMKWLIHFCIDSLFPGANFSRRGAALNILTLCMDHGFWSADNQEEIFAVNLIQCFLDSYEANKGLAKNLLSKMSLKALKFDDLHYVKDYLKNSLNLASSIRPPDSISAAYFIGLLASFSEVKSTVYQIYEKSVDLSKCPEEESSSFICLKILLEELKRELKTAQTSLLKASCSGPMYGLILVIRHLLQGISFSLCQDVGSWKSLVNDIIIVSFQCNEAVAFVVNNTSPEGLLPMDLDYDISQFEDNSEAPQVTAQMVLLCCWRTVKEVSLLLGEISENAPISSADSPGLITEEQILAIGDHLTGLLSETKHRGAFEQAYVGFCKLASRLWRYPKGNLHELPSQWLNDTLNDIATNNDLSATRRSAGIPFIVQGLVCTELEVGGGKCFHKGIKTLLKLAQDRERTIETRTHALNILRALFRHSLLGEMVSPYVAEGLALAIQGFNSNTWAERNSSTLLLSALMVRVFGVPRSNNPEVISWKNKMTGRIFFQCYPSLFSILYKHLESATNTNLYPAIYPALLILGRLYPSSLEGTDSNLQLNKYIPYVSDCAGSSILKTRTLAASAIVALITPNIFTDYVNGTYEKIFLSRKENLTHGLLLQVLKLLRNVPEECKTQVVTRLPVWMLVLEHLLDAGKHSYVVKECCLKICFAFASNFYSDIPTENWNKLISLLNQNLFYPCSIIDIVYPEFGSSGFLMHSALLVLYICYRRHSVEILIQTIINLLEHNEYLVIQITLQFMSSILEKKLKLFFEDINNVDPIDLSNLKTNDDLKDGLISSQILARIIANKLENCHHEDKLCVLRVIKFLPEVFHLIQQQNSPVQYFISLCETEPESIGSPAFDCITAFLSAEHNRSEIGESEFTAVCRWMLKYSDPSSDYECRFSVKELIIKNFGYLQNISSVDNVFLLWTTVLKLITDDEAEIRDSVCKMISGDQVPTKSLEMFFEKFYNSVDSELVKAGILLAWALGDCSLEEEDLDDNSYRVFDKGDTNAYSEEFIINELSCNCLKNLIDSSTNKLLLKEKLPSSVIDWLWEECAITINASESLENIVLSLNRTFQNFIKGLKIVTPFRQMEKKILIQEIKFKNILFATGLINEEILVEKFERL